MDACQALVALPREVRIVFAEGQALADEYGHPVPAKLLDGIIRRANPQRGTRHLVSEEKDRLTSPYAKPAEVSYASWSPERGHFGYPLAYPRLEARRIPRGKGWLVAVINHAIGGQPATAKLPWSQGDVYDVRELTAGKTVVKLDTLQTFAPLTVHLYRYEPKR